MAIIKPFKGITFNKSKVHDISKVISPPYDVITADDQDRYYRSDDHNIIRIILGKDLSGDTDQENKYSRANHYLNSWIDENILIEEKNPCIYVYEQEFNYDGRNMIRRGFLALIKLDDAGTVRFHENTFLKPKEDRLSLLRSCRTNTEPIFSLYQGNFAGRLSGEVIIEAADENGNSHRLIKVADEKQINNLLGDMLDKKVYIADGHHRFESAVNFARENKIDPKSEDPLNYTMMCFVNTSDSGLLVLPIHRVMTLEDEDVDYIMKIARKYFLIVEIDSYEKVKRAVGQVFGFLSRKDNKFYMFKLRDTFSKLKIMKEKGKLHLSSIDCAVLHALLLDDILEKYKNKKTDEFISYISDADEAIAQVKKGQRNCAFLMNPAKVSQIIEMADLGEKMPQKSTYFYPKLSSGIIMRKIN